MSFFMLAKIFEKSSTSVSVILNKVYNANLSAVFFPTPGRCWKDSIKLSKDLGYLFILE